VCAQGALVLLAGVHAACGQLQVGVVRSSLPLLKSCIVHMCISYVDILAPSTPCVSTGSQFSWLLPVVSMQYEQCGVAGVTSVSPHCVVLRSRDVWAHTQL
jgi:hypothetical protein